MNASFETMIKKNGLYSRHFLIYLYDVNKNLELRFINDIEDHIYDGETYKAAGFEYTPNAAVLGFDGGGTLNIAANEPYILDLPLSYREIKMEVVGCLLEDGTIEDSKKYRHHYGKVSYKSGKITFTFNADDRPGMTFPALIWNATNNHGNN